MPERWDDVRVTVTRPGPVDQRGPCANSIPQDDYKAASLPQGRYRSIYENVFAHSNIGTLYSLFRKM